MKLICLNTWGGKYFTPLIKFTEQHSADTDIFCFQEIYKTGSDLKQYNSIRTNLLDELQKVLTNFQYFYSTEISGFDEFASQVNFDLAVGKTIFIRKNIQITAIDDIVLYGNRQEKFLKKDFSNLAITLQSISFINHQKEFTITNIHGIAYPGEKLDTPIRLEHSSKIQEFLNSKSGAKILTGDFNLLPETKSIKILEQKMRNLIKEFNIKKTRSHLSPFYGRKDFQNFADYTFVSNDVNVKSFQVPEVEISDHLPMIMEFS